MIVDEMMDYCKHNYAFSRRSKSAIFGHYFINNVENQSDVKIIFKIFNGVLIYNDYTYNYSNRNSHFHRLLHIPVLQKVATQRRQREKG